MNTKEFLDYLKDLNIKLTVHGDKLRCSAPPGVLKPPLQDEIAERKDDILAYLKDAESVEEKAANIPPSLQEEDIPGTIYTPIQAVQRTPERLCLSFAQQRLWFLDQLEGANPVYNIPSACKLEGYLNLLALEQSLQEIVQRHEVLRTTFPSQNGVAHQKIQPNAEVKVPLIDLQAIPKAEQDTQVQTLIDAEVRQPFILAQDILIRFKLFKLDKTSHVLAITMHHIVSDGWSTGIFRRELSQLYTAFCEDRASPLAPLPIQYADFAHWQRQWLQGEVLERQLSYWQKQLANVPPLLELPTDRPRPPVQTFQGSQEYFELNEHLSQNLRTLCRQQKVTLFMLLLATFQTLLYRYSGETDIVVGFPIANRTRAEIEPLIGFFANTLALRSDFSDNPSFSELLNRIQQMTLDAYAHQDIPFERVVEALQPERNMSHAPLFQVMFVLQNVPMSDLDLSGMTLSFLDVETDTAKFDLLLSMREGSSGLKGRWEYNTDLFDPQTITRMIQHFEQLLEAIVADVEQQVARLPLLTVTERKLLQGWNNTLCDYPADRCIHQLFETQVGLTPDTVAVVFGKQQLSYRELNQRANQLARHLQTLGVSADVAVGICVERSLDLTLGILAILKAGGAYVPLDPTYPHERLTYMLSHSQATVLLTQQNLVGQLPEVAKHTVCLDRDWAIVSQQSTTNLLHQTQPDRLAYIIYTSGSTGQPKGVAMPHRALANLICWQVQHTAVPPDARTLQFAPISFDVSFQEIFSTWCAGGTLVLISEELRRDPMALLQLLQEQSIARLFLPFVALRQLAEVAKTTETLPSQLQEIITAGEQLQIVPAIRHLFSRLPNCTLHNHYGPSESHVVTALTLDSAIDRWSMLPSIGRPIANTQLYILDAWEQLVPIGVVGELYIGGVCLAAGYLNRPDLTAAKFIANPFVDAELAGGSSCCDRLYKTGDLARYLPDGNIEFLGRIDSQVKVRGFRIELGEVESTLAQYPAVEKTAVIVREEVTEHKCLVAYVVQRQATSLTIDELRRFLKQKLPDYMVPSNFVMLKALPLTPSGKVNRRALPAPDQNRQELEENFVAPRDDLEIQLANIWEKVLGIQPVGIRDNFFALGGHSLLAVRLFVEMEKTMSMNLSLATLFQAPTVEQLANIIRGEGLPVSWSSLVLLQSGGSKPPLFFPHGVGGNTLRNHILTHLLGKDRPLYGFQARGSDGIQLPRTQIEDMAACYVKEMQTIQHKGPYFLAGFCFGGLVAYEMAQQLQAQGQKVALLALLDAFSPKIRIQQRPKSRSARASNILKEMEKLNFIGKITYISGKIKGRVNRIKEQSLQQLKDIACDLYISQGWSLPHLLRHHYLLKTNAQASYDYVPKVYSGKVTLFRCTRQDSQFAHKPLLLGWDKLATGGVDLQEIEGFHDTMLREPTVQIVAQKLKTCLNKAQAEIEDVVQGQDLNHQRTIKESAGIVAIRSEGNYPPIFFVAPGSSTALQYHHLVSYLPIQYPCYCFQSIEIEDPETTLATIEEIAAYYIEQMLKVDSQEPYILSGRCGVGAAIIYEMALQLKEQKKQVHLIMLDPSYETFRSIEDKSNVNASPWLYYLYQIQFHWQRKQLLTRIKDKFLTRNSKGNRYPNDVEKINQSNLPVEKKRELINLFEQQRRAFRKYKPKATYQGTINLLLTDYRKRFGLVRYDYWKQLATEGLDIYMVPGHHNTILNEPDVQVLAEKIKLCLAKFR